MKTTLLAIFALFALSTKATNYYFSSTSGDDSRTSLQAQNPSTPWKSLSKLNATTLAAGDTVSFKSGDTFYGGITPTQSGTAGNKIVYNSYGIGAKPIITGFITVNSWTNLGGNIWESTSAVSALSTCKVVSINGVNTAMGRFPKATWLYNTHADDNSLVSEASLNSAATNWTGAEAVIRKNRWIVDRCSITAHSGTTLTTTNPSAYPALQNWGFFIQNDVRTLTQQNDWYYNNSTKKIRIYSTTSPTNVQVSSIDYLAYFPNINYITFDNIKFTGANNAALYWGSCLNITVTNCDFDFNYNAIKADNWGYSSANALINNNTFNHTNNNAVYLTNESTSATVTNNIVQNSGVLEGMSNSDDQAGLGIYVVAPSALIQYNQVINTGYCGIYFGGVSAQVKNNFVNFSCVKKDDGGAIYMYNDIAAGKIVDKNTCINNVGNSQGTDDTSVLSNSAHGIYIDGDFSGNLTITNNTVAYSGNSGIFLHNSHDITCTGNNVYDSRACGLLIDNNTFSATMSNLVINNNIFFEKYAPNTEVYFGLSTIGFNQLAMQIISSHGDLAATSTIGTFNNNYYARPIDDNLTINTQPNGQSYSPNSGYQHRTLAGWKSYSGLDAASQKSPKTITDVNDLRFEYNETASNKTVSLPFNYIDVKNVSYNGTITLAPYTSAVLIKNGIASNQPPIANAGLDQTITLPTNTASLNGSGIPNGTGTISSYNWTKISGPATGTITNPNSAATTITGLVQGVYQYQLKVTDNNGATASDTMQVTVNATGNISPIANAGTDQTITLPTNTVSLNGSGTDADGTISSYLWTKVSGPLTGTITNANSAASSVTGLVQGAYQFELKVTDNLGATGRDTMQVTVNAAGNIPPVANAGIDQTITLPKNSINLSGSGTDADGTISSYLWTKVSGPLTGTITNANSAATSVTGIVQGLYQFELKVTDNLGATGRDTMLVTVNVAGNIAPVANAGIDQTITLPKNSINLSGSGTDADGTISSYLWRMISGPSAATIKNANSASTKVTGLVQGVYQFELKVTDNLGATGLDTMQVTVKVTVNTAANINPVANAGTNQTLTLPTNIALLNGSGADADGSISSYNWTKISGPSLSTMNNPNSAATSVTGLVEGVYKFELKVTDNLGATGLDTVQITVNAAGNISPIANAGSDQTITLPTNNVLLNGSGADVDGTISSYLWRKISGPAAATINNPSSTATSVTGLVQGVYQFELKVTDNLGATGLDTMQITVKVTVNTAANISPVANAGTDQTITLPSNTALLNGSGTDADGSISSYLWTKISGPATGTINNANSAATSLRGLILGVYQFELKVTDNLGATGLDTVQITVNALSNISPIANAGSDQTITLPTNTALLNGSGADVDGTISSYLWRKISGPAAATINNSNSATTSVTGLIQGVYQFELKVTDNLGAIGLDTMQITVKVTVNTAANISPVANAGTDQIITLPTNTVLLNGSGADADGSISSYLWTKISGPAAGTINGANAAATSVTGLVQGVYQFELKVTDNLGATGLDTVQITVNALSNISPIANASSDQTITLPTNTALLNGSGADADGTISSYLWTKISGPAPGIITNANATATSVTGLVQGVYQFELKVTDNNGATGKDTMQLTVQATINVAANIPPVANAGSDQIITLPTNTVLLNGSGADADGSISSYLWTKISGPAAGTITNANAAATSVTALIPGVYKFELKVTDNLGATGLDTVQITVNTAGNISPIANAGSDQTITLPTNTALLNGSGADADGTISSYLWTKISGPAPGIITNVNATVTSVTGLVQGVYQFELKVTDNLGATSFDTVQITVNAAGNISPIANAGSDQTITLPTNTALLNGSGADADGSISSYLWTKISGPAPGIITNANATITTISGLIQGVYKFELKVTDNLGATGKDTIEVTVNAASNIPPVANAGQDITIVLPTNIVALKGSGTDADGSIVGYAWKQISGPLVSRIVSPNDSATAVNNLVAGTYKFELTVTDNNGATGKDTVFVAVDVPRSNVSVQSNTIKVYPNPVIDIVTLEINTTQASSKLLVIITNMQNQIVYKNELNQGVNNIKEKINMSILPKGTYAITVYFTDKEKQSIKLIKLN